MFSSFVDQALREAGVEELHGMIWSKFLVSLCIFKCMYACIHSSRVCPFFPACFSVPVLDSNATKSLLFLRSSLSLSLSLSLSQPRMKRALPKIPSLPPTKRRMSPTSIIFRFGDLTSGPRETVSSPPDCSANSPASAA